MRNTTQIDLESQKSVSSRRAAEEAIQRAKLSKTQSWRELLASDPNAANLPLPPACIRPPCEEMSS